MGAVAIVLQRREDTCRAGSLGLGELGRALPKSLQQDVAVTHGAEDRRQPAELVPDARGERRVDERSERPQIGAHPARRDSCLVDTFRVDIETDDRVVQDQADDRERECAAHDVAGGRVAREIGDRDLRHERCMGGQRSDVLRRLVGCACARLAKPFDECIEKIGRHVVSDLHLELAEAGRAPVVEDGDRVVDHASDEPPVRVVKLGATAERRHPHAHVELLVADESADELDRGGRW